MLIYPQDVHERALVERLDSLGLELERRTELVRFKQTAGGVRARLRKVDGAEDTCEGPNLAGCDGARSTVGETLGIGIPGGTYDGNFFVADVEGSGPAVNGETHGDLTWKDLLSAFPLKKTGRVRLVGTVVERSPEEHAKLTFDDIRNRLTGHLRFSIERANWFSTYHVHHRVASRFREGRAFVLGDAAHFHSPVGGQGMNTGIGEAVNLAWKLAAVLKGSDPGLLDSYEPERIAFARKLVASTDRAFAAVTTRGPVARRLRTRFMPMIAPCCSGCPRYAGSCSAPPPGSASTLAAGR